MPDPTDLRGFSDLILGLCLRGAGDLRTQAEQCGAEGDLGTAIAYLELASGWAHRAALRHEWWRKGELPAS